MASFEELKNELPLIQDITILDAYVGRCIDLIRTECVPNRKYDPRSFHIAQTVSNHLGEIARDILLRYKMFFISYRILTIAWDQFAEVQYTSRERVYRAGLGTWLAQLCRLQGDIGATVRWTMYAHADDLLGDYRDGAAKSLLYL